MPEIRTKSPDGDETITVITDEQLFDIERAIYEGKPAILSYPPRDERVALTEDGTFVEYDSAVPDARPS